MNSLKKQIDELRTELTKRVATYGRSAKEADVILKDMGKLIRLLSLELKGRSGKNEAVRDYLRKRSRAANRARNEKLSARKRKQIARKAARTRWAARRRHAV